MQSDEALSELAPYSPLKEGTHGGAKIVSCEHLILVIVSFFCLFMRHSMVLLEGFTLDRKICLLGEDKDVFCTLVV